APAAAPAPAVPGGVPAPRRGALRAGAGRVAGRDRGPRTPAPRGGRHAAAVRRAGARAGNVRGDVVAPTADTDFVTAGDRASAVSTLAPGLTPRPAPRPRPRPAR